MGCTPDALAGRKPRRRPCTGRAPKSSSAVIMLMIVMITILAPTPARGQCYRASATATAYVHCDDELTVYVSGNNGASFTLDGGHRSWGKAYVLAQTVTKDSVFRFVCRDDGVVGGFLATVHVDTVTYSTADPITGSGWSPSTTIDVYKAQNAQPWGVNFDSSKISPDARWVWNGATDNTITFDFALEPHMLCTSAPTRQPTARPTPTPTKRPTARPTPQPTQRPTLQPTPQPTAPTPPPTPAPTFAPTAAPSDSPTAQPTAPPTPVRASLTFRSIQPDPDWFPANTTAFLRLLQERLLGLLPVNLTATSAPGAAQLYFQRMTAEKGSIIVSYDDDAQMEASAAVASAVQSPGGLTFSYLENGTVYTMSTAASPGPPTGGGGGGGGGAGVVAGVVAALAVVAIVVVGLLIYRRHRYQSARGSAVIHQHSQRNGRVEVSATATSTSRTGRGVGPSASSDTGMYSNPLFRGQGQREGEEDGPPRVAMERNAAGVDGLDRDGSAAESEAEVGSSDERYALPLQATYTGEGADPQVAMAQRSGHGNYPVTVSVPCGTYTGAADCDHDASGQSTLDEERYVLPAAVDGGGRKAPVPANRYALPLQATYADQYYSEADNARSPIMYYARTHHGAVSTSSSSSRLDADGGGAGAGAGYELPVASASNAETSTGSSRLALLQGQPGVYAAMAGGSDGAAVYAVPMEAIGGAQLQDGGQLQLQTTPAAAYMEPTPYEGTGARLPPTYDLASPDSRPPQAGGLRSGSDRDVDGVYAYATSERQVDLNVCIPGVASQDSDHGYVEPRVQASDGGADSGSC